MRIALLLLLLTGCGYDSDVCGGKLKWFPQHRLSQRTFVRADGTTGVLCCGEDLCREVQP